MKARKNRAFFVETLIITFLLLLMLTILVRIFGAAAQKSRYAERDFGSCPEQRCSGKEKLRCRCQKDQHFRHHPRLLLLSPLLKDRVHQFRVKHVSVGVSPAPVRFHRQRVAVGFFLSAGFPFGKTFRKLPAVYSAVLLHICDIAGTVIIGLEDSLFVHVMLFPAL